MNEILNIFGNVKSRTNEEIFEKILTTDNFSLERIISEGHSSPENFWYDQDKNEFVLLISGAASIRFEGGQIFNMKPGDYLIINAHQRHRVDWTDPDQKTFWIALHY